MLSIPPFFLVSVSVFPPRRVAEGDSVSICVCLPTLYTVDNLWRASPIVNIDELNGTYRENIDWDLVLR